MKAVKSTKITKVSANNRKRCFSVQARGQSFVFPYSRVQNPPMASDDRVMRVYIDPELAHTGFTFDLSSGDEGSTLLDEVLEYNQDPNYLAQMAIYRMTREAKGAFDASELSAREIARRLGTSTAQLYRLLDTTNYTKSMSQMFALLSVLGCEVSVNVKPLRLTRKPVAG